MRGFFQQHLVRAIVAAIVAAVLAFLVPGRSGWHPENLAIYFRMALFLGLAFAIGDTFASPVRRARGFLVYFVATGIAIWMLVGRLEFSLARLAFHVALCGLGGLWIAGVFLFTRCVRTEGSALAPILFEIVAIGAPVAGVFTVLDPSASAFFGATRLFIVLATLTVARHGFGEPPPFPIPIREALLALDRRFPIGGATWVLTGVIALVVLPIVTVTYLAYSDDLDAEPSSTGEFQEYFGGGLWVEEQDGLFGYVNRFGIFVIPPTYDNIPGPFSEGLAAVTTGTDMRTRRWGYIDESGRMVIPERFGPNFAGSPEFANARFSMGLAAVREGGLWGYIDRTGTYVIPPRFATAGPFCDGLAAVQLPDYGAGTASSVEEQFVRELVGGIRGRPGSAGYINTSGEFVIPPQFADAGEFSEGRAPVKLSTAEGGEPLWGYIDASGKVVIPPRFQWAQPFRDGVARVTYPSSSYAYTLKSKLIDRNGDTALASRIAAVQKALRNYVPGAAVRPENYGYCPRSDVMVVYHDGTLRHAGDLRVGDRLRSIDPESGRPISVIVRAVRHLPASEWIQILPGVVVTPRHLVLTTKGWTRVSDLPRGAWMRSAEGAMEAMPRHLPAEAATAVAITVSEPHHYLIAGPNGTVMSHNKPAMSAGIY